MADFFDFPDLFSEVVSKVRLSYDTENNLLPVFEFGTRKELYKALLLRDDNEKDKYPLVWLVWERNYTKRQFRDVFANKEYTISPLIFIIKNTNVDYSANQRKELIFKPILKPIYQGILSAIRTSGNFNTGNTIDHDVYDNYYWGVNDQGESVLADDSDSMELELFDLKVMRQC